MNLFEGAMLAMQVGAGIVALANSQHVKLMYWIGAFILTLAVVRGMR